jgi:hypothetical protein
VTLAYLARMLAQLDSVPLPDTNDYSPWPTGNSRNGAGQPYSRPGVTPIRAHRGHKTSRTRRN